jgi:hypothetical protein
MSNLLADDFNYLLNPSWEAVLCSKALASAQLEGWHIWMVVSEWVTEVGVDKLSPRRIQRCSSRLKVVVIIAWSRGGGTH